MYHMKPGEKEELIKRLHFYYNQHMSGINRRKEMLAIIVLLERSGMKISKTAQIGQDYEVANSGKGGIIKSSGVFENNIDSHIPEDKVIYRKNEQGKTIAINSETGEVSGCGSEIDNRSKKNNLQSKGESQSDKSRIIDNNPNSTEGNTQTIQGKNVFKLKKEKDGSINIPVGSPVKFCGREFKFEKDFKISDPITIAKGITTKEQARLIHNYGGQYGTWRKKSGKARVLISGEPKDVQVHWFESTNGYSSGMKIVPKGRKK